MPVIFAFALILSTAPMLISVAKTSPIAAQIVVALNNGWPHYLVLAAMIFFFSYFWVATQFQPSQIADDLKKYGGHTPGRRPGEPTAAFLPLTPPRRPFSPARERTQLETSLQ